MSPKNNSFGTAQILLPVALLSLVVFMTVGFQTKLVFDDRAKLHEQKAGQDKPLEEARRVNAQLNALAEGTSKLAQQGDKRAQAIIDQMKKLGIISQPPQAAADATQAPAHIAMPTKP